MRTNIFILIFFLISIHSFGQDNKNKIKYQVTDLLVNFKSIPESAEMHKYFGSMNSASFQSEIMKAVKIHCTVFDISIIEDYSDDEINITFSKDSLVIKYRLWLYGCSEGGVLSSRSISLNGEYRIDEINEYLPYAEGHKFGDFNRDNTTEFSTLVINYSRALLNCGIGYLDWTEGHQQKMNHFWATSSRLGLCLDLAKKDGWNWELFAPRITNKTKNIVITNNTKPPLVLIKSPYVETSLHTKISILMEKEKYIVICAEKIDKVDYIKIYYNDGDIDIFPVQNNTPQIIFLSNKNINVDNITCLSMITYSKKI